MGRSETGGSEIDMIPDWGHGPNTSGFSLSHLARGLHPERNT